MNDTWLIPRVTIMPTSSLSNTLNASKTILTTEIAAKQKQQQQHLKSGKKELPTPRPPSAISSEYLHENFHFEYKNNYRWYFNHRNTRIDQQQSHQKPNGTSQMSKQNVGANYNRKVAPDSAITVKRGSKLSQSSNSDGNNSASSIASDSLLLTAANLERFTAIQQKKTQNMKYLPISHNSYMDSYQLPCHDVNVFDSRCSRNMNYNKTVDRDIFNVNMLQMASNVYDDDRLTQNELNHIRAPKIATTATTIPQQQTTMKFQSDVHHFNDIERNLNLMKTTKDLDAASIASSMHFTMINGEAGRNNTNKRKSLCDRGRQVTVLITTMSIVFLILILSMVFALEMRARYMLHS